MSRKARKESSTDFYHVVARGINRETVLKTRREREYFQKILHEHSQLYPVKIYGYCIMNNHIHFLINAKLDTLSSFMAKLLAKYAKFYNCKYHRKGYVFQDRFHSDCIDTEEYFWNCWRYIHNNPVKAGSVGQPQHYKYSSLREYYEQEPHILHEDAIEFINDKFKTTQEMLDYHMQTHHFICYDIEEDLKMHRKVIGERIVEEFSHKYNLDPQTIWSSARHRNECIQMGQEFFEASRRETTDILEHIIYK